MSGRWRTFAYDAYGNLWVTGNGGAPLAGNTPTADYNGNNQINGRSVGEYEPVPNDLNSILRVREARIVAPNQP